MAGFQCLHQKRKGGGVLVMEGELSKKLPLIPSLLLPLPSTSPKGLSTFPRSHQLTCRVKARSPCLSALVPTSIQIHSALKTESPEAFIHPEVLANLWVKMEKQGLTHLSFCAVCLQPKIELNQIKKSYAIEVMETDNYKVGTHMEITGESTDFKFHYSEWKCSCPAASLDAFKPKNSDAETDLDKREKVYASSPTPPKKV